MNQAFLPFSRPSIGDEEIAAVEQVPVSYTHLTLPTSDLV